MQQTPALDEVADHLPGFTGLDAAMKEQGTVLDIDDLAASVNDQIISFGDMPREGFDLKLAPTGNKTDHRVVLFCQFDAQQGFVCDLPFVIYRGAVKVQSQ